MSDVVTRLRALLSEATPGRWRVASDSTDQVYAEDGDMVAETWGTNLVEDALVIVALHNAADALLAVAEAAQRFYAANAAWVEFSAEGDIMDDQAADELGNALEDADATLVAALAELSKVQL